MNPLVSMMARAKKSTSPIIALFTWAAVWVFSTEQPAIVVLEFIEKTDPLKLAFGVILVVGSLFLGWRPEPKDKPVELTDELPPLE